MRRYELVSGIAFVLLGAAHVGRLLLGIPAQVGTIPIPMWTSVVAVLATWSMAAWAFRSGRVAT